jgi:hypothetical protein
MWKQQWTAFWSAPLVIGPLIAVAGFVIWWFRGKLFEAQIAGLKEQIAVVEQRLKLAADAMPASDQAKRELQILFDGYKAEVASKGRNASPAKVDAAIVKVSDGDAAVKSGLQGAIESLHFGQYGALRKLDPETLKILQDLGPAIKLDDRKFD